MTWFIFALLTAFFVSLKNIFCKESVLKINEYVVAWALRFFGLIFLIPFLFFVDIPSFNNQFWLALFVSGVLNAIATVLFVKSIKNSDLSIVVPLIAFTPLFLLITSPLILGEFPKFLGLIGVLLIVFGSYILHADQSKKGFLKPFKLLLSEKGSRQMLVVSFLWSISANFDKIGVQNSNPIVWVVAIHVFLVIILLPTMTRLSDKAFPQIRKNLKFLLPIGLFGALTLACQMISINLTLVAYVVAIKRLSIVLSVLFGYFFFKEKHFKERLAGSAVMIAGILLILIA